MPAHQVMTFQTMAPISAREDHRGVDDGGVDDAGADRLRHMQAEEQEGDEVEERGPEHGIAAARSTRVETMVAMELAASCRPLRKSNSSATAIRPTSSGRAEASMCVRPQTCSMTMPLISLATSSKRSTTFSRWS